MLMVQRLNAGWSDAAVATAYGVTPRTVRKWRDRYAAEGEAGLADRSSRPQHSPTQLSHQAEAEILALRRQRQTGPVIARRLGRPVSTVGVVLRRNGLGRLRALDPRPEVIRYQRDRPGELLHIDIKKLGRIDASATGSPATAPARATSAAPAGNIFMWRSMMPAGSPIPSCCPMSARKAPWTLPAVPSPSSPVTASASSGS